MRSAMFFMIVLLFGPPLFGETLDDLNREIARLDAQSDHLKKEYEAGKKANEERLRKNDTELLREAYAAAEKLNQINSLLNQIQQDRMHACELWRKEYERTIDSLLALAQNEKDRRKKGEIGKKLQFYQSRNAQLCSESFKSSVSQEWKSIRIEPYDGPPEIRQKTQMLNDIAREVSINLTKLDQQFQSYQREQKTKDRAQEFIQESTLFTDSLTVRPATRSDGVSTNGAEGPLDHSSGDGTTAAPQFLGNSDWSTKWTTEEFETQYQKMRAALLSQQEQLQTKIEEFDRRAKDLMNPR